MFNSNQVSAMLAAQQQQAMMMAQGASMMSMRPEVQLGASTYPPAFNVGMQAATGGGMGMSPIFQPAPPIGFQYGIQPGPTIGSHLASGMAGMSAAIPAGLGAISAGAGMAQMFGMGGPLVGLASMTTPAGAGMAVASGGYGAAAGMGLGVGGRLALGAGVGMGAGLAMMAGYEAVRLGAGTFIGGMQQQNALSAAFSQPQFQFANMGAPTGRGFSASQVNRIGTAMRAFDAADPFTAMADMNATMQKFTEMGMSQGIRDADQFSAKFKKMAETVRSMAIAMGTTMDEAAKTFGGMRQAGFFSAQEVMGNTAQMRMMGGMGMGQDQFMAMQATGAGMARAQQMSGISGARAVTNLASMFSMNPGREQQIMDITGASDLTSGAAALSQDVVGRTMSFLNRGSAGAATLAALGKTDTSGRFTGEIDRTAIAKMLSGKIGYQELSKMGQSRLTSGAGQASFVANQRDITQSLMQNEDVVPAIIQAIRASAGGSDDMGIILTEQLTGLDRRTTKEIYRTLDDWKGNKAAQARRLREEMGAEIMQAEISRNRSVRGVWQKIKGGATDLLSPIAQAGGDFLAETEMATASVWDAALGIQRAGSNASMSAAALSASRGEALRGPEAIYTDRTISGVLSGRMLAAELDPGLTMSIAKASSTQTALNATILAGKGENLTAEDLGIVQTDAQSLQKHAQVLQRDPRLQKLVEEARLLTEKGHTTAAKAKRREIESYILEAMPGKTGNVEEDRIKAALVLSQSGGGSLVRDAVLEDASVVSTSTVKDINKAVANFNTQYAKGSLGRAASHWKLLGAATMIAGPVNVLIAAQAGMALELFKGHQLASGTRKGGEVLAAAAGKEGEFHRIISEEVAKAQEGSGPKDSGTINENIAKRLQEVTGTVMSAEGVAAYRREEEVRGVEGIKGITAAAAGVTKMAGTSILAENLNKSLQGLSIPGLDKEIAALRKAKTGGLGEGGEMESLLMKIAAKGDDFDASVGTREGILGGSAALIRELQGQKGVISSGDLRKKLKDSGIEVGTIDDLGGEGATLDKGQALKKAMRLITAQTAVDLAGGSATGGVAFSGNLARDPQIVAMMKLAEMIDKVDSKIDGSSAPVTGGGPTQSMIGGIYNDQDAEDRASLSGPR